MKVLVVTGTRAEWGLWTPVLAEMRRRPDAGIDVRVVVTGMHLDDRFGRTVDEVRASGYEIAGEVACTPAGDSRAEMASALGQCMVGMAPVVEKVGPDWLLLLGDRGEQLAGGLVALHQGTAVAHLHGGERTLGAVDDAMRDMITRLSHLHFAADESAAARLRHLGEAEWRIMVTGAPGLDNLVELVALADREHPHTRPEADYAVVIYHPETVGDTDQIAALDAILQAVERRGLTTVAILPNADAGARALRDTLLERLGRLGALHASLPREDYVRLIADARVLIGNSSSGLIEAPLLKLPVVNVGDRQRGRLRGDNVIDVPADPIAIRTALDRALSTEFRSNLSGVSPYGRGDASRQIVDALLSATIDTRLLVKEVG